MQRRLTESADLFLWLDQSPRSRSCASAYLRPAPPLWLTVVLCTCVFVRMCMRACKPQRVRVCESAWIPAFVCSPAPDASACADCQAVFSLIKRKKHCKSCGKARLTAPVPTLAADCH